MLRRSTAIVFTLFILLGLACNLTSRSGVPTGPAAKATQASAPTSESIPPSPSTSEAPKAVSDAVLEILYSEGTASVSDWKTAGGCVPQYRDTAGGLLPLVPPNETHLKVAQDGSLEGTCYADRETTIESGSLTGKIDWASGKITYHLETKAEYIEENITTTVTVVLDATGEITTADKAAGGSTWSLQCRAAASGGRTCDAPGTPNELSLDVTGTSPWQMWLLRY